MGEPSGIGGELTLKTWRNRAQTQCPAFVVFDDPARLQTLADSLGYDVPIRLFDALDAIPADVFNQALPVYPIPLSAPCILGKPELKNAGAVIASIDHSVQAVQDGYLSAVVTNPIQKSTLYEAGFTAPGHTEYLAQLAGSNIKSIMMLAGPDLRTVPVTIHEPLKDAVKNLTTDAIVHAGRVLAAALKQHFHMAAPVIAVAGLNPHAGEAGTMGREDIDIIQPAINQLISEGIDARGPMPADTMFAPGPRQTYDAALCMYHDQALIPVKTLDIDNTVNVTLGLPFVRTSPDHGTALDIAGTGQANPASLMAALRLAAQMTKHDAASS